MQNKKRKSKDRSYIRYFDMILNLIDELKFKADIDLKSVDVVVCSKLRTKIKELDKKEKKRINVELDKLYGKVYEGLENDKEII